MSENKNQLRDFDKEAAKWDEKPTRVRLARDIGDTILRQVKLRPDMDVLDFGCGTGLVALRVAPLVRSVTGADSSSGMLEVFREKAARDGLANVRAMHLEAGVALSGSYDLVLSSMTFHHVLHIDALLAEFYRLLKNPGYLCVADLDPDQGEFHDDNTGIFHFGFDRKALGESFRKAGFSKVTDFTAAEITKPRPNGEPRKFSIFLLVGEKTGN
jgi:ubiquinone/menaquinone biosynthesis C-methylase UbiE